MLYFNVICDTINQILFRNNENLKKYIPNYKINLIDAARLENLELFQRDLQVIFGLLKYRKDTQKMKKYVEDNKEFFENVDLDTGMAISAFMNSDSIMKNIEQQKAGEGVNMCKALEDWAAEERAEGRLEGIEDNLVNLICKKLAKGKDIVQIADEIEETVEVVKTLMKKHNL